MALKTFSEITGVLSHIDSEDLHEVFLQHNIIVYCRDSWHEWGRDAYILYGLCVGT